MSTPFRLQLPRVLLEQMILHARAELPCECCGLLAGEIVDAGAAPPLVRVRARLPLVNALHSPTQFESEPRSMFAALRALKPHGWEVLAVYHSHPTSAPRPSLTDLARNWWPGTMQFIIGLAEKEPDVRAWWLEAESYSEAAWDEVE